VIELPVDVQLSSTPIEGKFRITCPIEGNYNNSDPITTAEIKYNQWWRWVLNALFNDCPGMYDKVELWDSGEHGYTDNGRGMMIRFVGTNGP
jgi:hypothetical protein